MSLLAGRYLLTESLGEGAMGSVWRAFDCHERRYVAAKVLGLYDAGLLLRFVREQSVLVVHPHVLAPTGWAAEGERVVFTMDLVRGGSLADLLADPAAFEDLDIEAVAARGYQFVRLNQLALEHALGAR